MAKKQSKSMLYSQAWRMALGWIDVNDQLPDPEEYVLLNTNCTPISDVGYMQEDGKWTLGLERTLDEIDITVTAWMPLPHSFESIKRDMTVEIR